MQRIKTAVIGCGKVGRTHAEIYRSLGGCQLAAVCDADPERSDSFAADFGVRGFDSVRRMLDECQIDAVSICTPHPLHEAPCVEAAGRGAHVLVEKPLASTVRACDAMIDAARSAGNGSSAPTAHGKPSKALPAPSYPPATGSSSRRPAAAAGARADASIGSGGLEWNERPPLPMLVLAQRSVRSRFRLLRSCFSSAHPAR